MFPHRLAAIALLLNTLVVSTPVAATSFDLMFERVSDIPGGTELAFLRYDDREALLNNTPSGLDEFSPIDIAPIFSTTGLAYDGSQYIVMFERVDDIPGVTELDFLFYDDREALLNNTPSGLDRFSPIDIAPIFSTTGLAYDGSQYILMFERDDDIPGGTELAFLFYDDLAALLNNTPSGLDRFSPIDIAPIFSTTGLDYDGSQYILMFERVDDIPGVTELDFLFYDDIEALLNNRPSGLDRFSPIDIAPIFSTTGLTSVWSGGPAPVPTPGSVPLLLVAAAALVAVTARSRAAAARLTGGCALRRP